MQITLAPIPFYWSRDDVFSFYQQAADWPLDRICLGETICSKRREMKLEDWLEIGRMLTAKGKQVVLSTLALIEAQAELKTLNRICQQDEFEVEANDLAAVEQCHQLGKPFSSGPYLNIYNSTTLKLLADDGLQRWTLPIELGESSLKGMLAAIEQQQINITTEVMVHGYLPLALSARCFTARALDKPKDQCDRICLDYPTGIEVTSSEQQPLFTMNGIQTLSGDILDLRQQLPQLRALGVDCIRISPSQFAMGQIINAYADSHSGNYDTPTPPSSARYCNGYWFDEAGFVHHGFRLKP
ncbi:MAG: U32 family peptidase [Reinekea sp.]